jgi:hypothetical protein
MRKSIILGAILCPILFSGCAEDVARSLSPTAVMNKLQNSVSDMGHSATKSGKKIKGDEGEHIQPWEVKKSTELHGKLDVLFAIEGVKTKDEAKEALKKLSRVVFDRVHSDIPTNNPNIKSGKHERYQCMGNGSGATCCSGFWDLLYPADNTFVYQSANVKCIPYEDDSLSIGVLELAGKYWVVVKNTNADTQKRSLSGRIFDVILQAGSGHFDPNKPYTAPSSNWQRDLTRMYTKVAKSDKYPQFKNFVDVHLDSKDPKAEEYRKIWSDAIMEELDK